jgi:hypothetical protein
MPTKRKSRDGGDIKPKKYNSHHRRNAKRFNKTQRRNRDKNGNNNNKTRIDDGWIRITIRGAPYERGVDHGKQAAHLFPRMFSVINFLCKEGYGRDTHFFFGLCEDFYQPIIEKRFPKIFKEMKGIADGAKLPVSQVVFINIFLSLPYFYAHLLRYIDTPKYRKKYADVIRDELAISANPTALANRTSRLNEFKDRCSLIMAVGEDWTKANTLSGGKGGIVCGHTSFSNFLDGQFCNILLRIEPEVGDGHTMVMQSMPGGVFSMTDFFVTSAGIIGSETTIRGFNAFELRDPICCRIRECMQYGNTLEEYAERLQKRNSGDYACSWMFGDINQNRIMRVELGLNYVNVEITKNGVFIGFNSAYDERIRNIECADSLSLKANNATGSGAIDSGGGGGGGGTSGFRDISSSIGNRRVQFEKLVEKYRGRIDTDIVKRILTDHYDNHLGKTEANSRTICKHGYSDNGEGGAGIPYRPVGAYDTKVVDSALAKRMTFLAHWGPPCGMPFSVKDHMKKHPEWKDWAEHLVDFPRRGWVDA